MGGFAEPSITADFCQDIYDRWSGGTANAPLAQMGKNMENGMVLAMSAWYAASRTMGWGVVGRTQVLYGMHAKSPFANSTGGDLPTPGESDRDVMVGWAEQLGQTHQGRAVSKEHDGRRQSTACVQMRCC